MKTVIATVTLIISGFLLLVFTFATFISNKPSGWWHLPAVFFGFPAAVLFAIGAALLRPSPWPHLLGVVLLSVAGTTAAMAVVMACVFNSPEFKAIPHQVTAADLSVRDGALAVLCLTAIGLILLRSRRALSYEEHGAA